MIGGGNAAGLSAWRINPLLDLQWHDWGSDSIAFECGTGQLYRFEPLAAAVVAYFEEGSAWTLQQLSAQARSDLGAGWIQEHAEAVTVVVAELTRMGWITSDPD